MIADGQTADGLDQVCAARRQDVSRMDARHVLGQARADDGKIRMRLQDGEREIRDRLPLRILVHDQDNVWACLCYPRADLLPQAQQSDQLHIRFGAQNRLHALAEKMIRTHQQYAMLWYDLYVD
jgi:hypothetical protein